MSLPASCAVCVFYDATPSLCRRHTAAPGDTEHELVHWPKVKASARCGAGDAGDEKDSPQIVACRDCEHWWQPDGKPISPATRRGRSREWWAGTGLCTRWAPSPSTEESRRTEWRCTHATDGCGDGSASETDDEEEIGEIRHLEEAPV